MKDSEQRCSSSPQGAALFPPGSTGASCPLICSPWERNQGPGAPSSPLWSRCSLPGPDFILPRSFLPAPSFSLLASPSRGARLSRLCCSSRPERTSCDVNEHDICQIDGFTSSSSITSFHYFYPNYNARTFRIMLNKNGENGHPCFVSSLGGGGVSICVNIIKCDVSVCFSYARSRVIPFILSFLT